MNSSKTQHKETNKKDNNETIYYDNKKESCLHILTASATLVQLFKNEKEDNRNELR